ncbi:hypothetical protein H0H81_004602 [Sphagnurus paluster]|uniref:Uncharacterized protein n=1 Tax=Sphagnurus paluster TaxID=117069 RepID=A0A9P7FR48_9AGAR|nr:hypothetical protein H0H81_004602 [Sphagnurus paluster]
MCKSAAAIYQVRPKSSLFCLPALASEEVKLWMSTVFPSQLAALGAAGGDPVDLEQIQASALQQALEQMRHLSSLQTQQLEAQATQLAHLNDKLDC